MTERILNDRYALEQKVGEGGMAVTYRARDLQLNRTVAIKLLREQFTSDPQYVERFRWEAQAAARLSHDNIAAVYDTGSANGSYYIVMEFIEGTDLKQRLRREGPLSILNALEIARQIAAALDAAHRSGLVHRDIKPHNILINQDGKVKVADFGIAKQTSEGEDTGVIMGSVHYISPEQARGEVTTPSSDLYSLGTVLFEMLTGRTLFEADNAMAVAHKQIYDRPPLPRTLRPEIPPAVESVVMRCLEKDPRARYQSAAEVQAVLAQLCNQLAQEETIIITPPAAPSMDSTMLYHAPAAKPVVVPARPQVAPVYPPQQQPAGPNRPPNVAAPPGGNSTGWIIGILFVVLAVGVGIFAYKWMTPPNPPPSPVDPAQALTVPSVLQKDQNTAQSLLTAAGFVVTVQPGNDASTLPGVVYNQDPPANTPAKKGDTVTIFVSGNATPVPVKLTMPDVAGKTVDDATQAIKAAGFTGKISQKTQESPTALPGTVISSTPPASASVDSTSKVTLLVALSTVTETVDMGTVPDIGVPMTYVCLKVENPSGSTATVILEGEMKPNDPIKTLLVKHNVNDQIHVILFAGKDKDNLSEYSDKYFPSKQPVAGQ